MLFSAHELNPLLGAARPRALSRRRPGGARHRRRGHHRPGAVAALRLADRRRCVSRAGSSSCPASMIVETGAEHRPRCLTMSFMRNAFAASGIVARGGGRRRLLPRAARPDLRRPRAVPCRLRRRDRRGADRRSRRSGGWSASPSLAGHRHGAARRAPQRPRRRHRHRARRCRSASACCSCISTPPMRPRRRRCCSATCWASIAQTLWTLLGARPSSASWRWR